jgi:hypothetical protein
MLFKVVESLLKRHLVNAAVRHFREDVLELSQKAMANLLKVSMLGSSRKNGGRYCRSDHTVEMLEVCLDEEHLTGLWRLSNTLYLNLRNAPTIQRSNFPTGKRTCGP